MLLIWNYIRLNGKFFLWNDHLPKASMAAKRQPPKGSRPKKAASKASMAAFRQPKKENPAKTAAFKAGKKLKGSRKRGDPSNRLPSHKRRTSFYFSIR